MIVIKSAFAYTSAVPVLGIPNSYSQSEFFEKKNCPKPTYVENELDPVPAS